MTTQSTSHEGVTLRLRELLAALLEVDVSAIHEDDQILDSEDSTGLGLDSLDILKLALSLAEDYDLREPIEIDFRAVTTVRDAAVLVHRLATA